MSAKKFVFSLISVLYIFLAVNLTLWHGCTKKFFTQRDLNRLGSFYTEPELTAGTTKYKQQHTEFTKGLQGNFDVITIGDSFSQNGSGNYYQDYLTDKFGIKILNMEMKESCIKILYKLITSGMIDEFKPKAVILESVERGVNGALGKSEMFPVKVSREDVEKLLKPKAPENISSGIFAPIMIKVNLQFLRDIFYRMLKPEQLSPVVYINELTQKLFTNPGQEDLFIHYYEDLNYLSQALNAEMINFNLNKAAKILAEKNIRLIFFAGVDKYDLYYPYIKHKHGRYENPFFDEMRKVQPKDYIFIDTKALLRKALERGEKDIYWLSDTHWSWKGQQIVSEEIAKYLLP